MVTDALIALGLLAQDPAIDRLQRAKQALEAAPESFQANQAYGVALDVTGRYGEARAHFEKAIRLAPTPQNQATALRAMAMSYAFERNCRDAIPYGRHAHDVYLSVNDFYTSSATWRCTPAIIRRR